MTLEKSNPARVCGAAGLGIVTGLAGYDTRLSSAAHSDLQRAWLAARHPMPADPFACRSRLSLLSELAFATNRRRA
jgi:hypothetical protein